MEGDAFTYRVCAKEYLNVVAIVYQFRKKVNKLQGLNLLTEQHYLNQ